MKGKGGKFGRVTGPDATAANASRREMMVLIDKIDEQRGVIDALFPPQGPPPWQEEEGVGGAAVAGGVAGVRRKKAKLPKSGKAAEKARSKAEKAAATKAKEERDAALAALSADDRARLTRAGNQLLRLSMSLDEVSVAVVEVVDRKDAKVVRSGITDWPTKQNEETRRIRRKAAMRIEAYLARLGVS